MLQCRLLGHRVRFVADGARLRWYCERGCVAEGDRDYASAEDARRYARALDRDPRTDLGRRAPPFALLPLRLAHRLRARRG
jgi:hypothetical protein